MTKIWHNEHTKFKSVSQLKQSLCESFEDKLNGCENFLCGYLNKSARQWIENDLDLEAMYETFKKGHSSEITL